MADADMQTSDEERLKGVTEEKRSSEDVISIAPTKEDQTEKLEQLTTPPPQSTIDTQDQIKLDTSQSAKGDPEEVREISDNILPTNEIEAANDVEQTSIGDQVIKDSNDARSSSENAVVVDQQTTGKDVSEIFDESMHVDVGEGSSNIPVEPIAEEVTNGTEIVVESADEEVDPQTLDGLATIHHEAEVGLAANKDTATEDKNVISAEKPSNEGQREQANDDFAIVSPKNGAMHAKESDLNIAEDHSLPQSQHSEEKMEVSRSDAAEDAPTEKVLSEDERKELSNESISEKTVYDQQTEKATDDQQTEKVVDDQQTEKAVDDQQTEKAADDQQTEKVVDDQQTEKASDDQQTEKVVHDQQTEKAVDDQQTEKAADDQQTEETAVQSDIIESQTKPSDEGAKVVEDVGSGSTQQQSETAAIEPSEVQAPQSAISSVSPTIGETVGLQTDDNATKDESKVEVDNDDALKVANHVVQPASINAEAIQSEDKPEDPIAVTQIAILLKINKELIRLCIDLQGKQQMNDPIYKECALRLQANLAFLAAMAEPSSGTGTKQTNATLNDEAFPITSMTSETLLPKLYAHLRSISTEPKESLKEAEPSKEPAAESNQDASVSHQEDVMQKSSDQSSSSSSPNTAGSKKRRRTSSEQDSQSNRTAPGRSASSNGTNPTIRRKSSTSASAVATPVLSTPALAMPQAVPAASSVAATDMAAHSPNLPLPNGSATGINNSPAQGPSTISPQPIGARNGNPTPQQLQGLIQAFGQNAVNNLNALQSHYRSGQPQAVIAYMESNVPNFRNLPLQLQLQQMASVQNAAIQRQRQASIGSTISNNAASPGAPGTPQSQQPGPPHQRRPSAAAPSPGGDQLRRSTQSPMSAPSVPPFSQQATVNGIGQQNHQAPGTPVNMSMPFGNVASPATSAASPGTFGQNQSMQPFQQQQSGSGMHNQMGGSVQRANPGNGQQQHNFNMPTQSQQQPNMPITSQAQQMFASLPPQLSSLPAHLQQQLLQNLLMQQQQQQQAQVTSQPMAPPAGMNPMMAAMFGQATQQQQSSPSGNFRPGDVGLSGNAGQANGMPNLANMWANMQQQQQNNTQ